MRQPMLSRVFKVINIARNGLHSSRICCFKHPMRTFKIKTSSDSFFIKPSPKEASSRLDPVTLHRLKSYHRSYYTRRMIYSSIGVIFGMLGLYITAIQAPLPPSTTSDSSSPNSPSINHLDSNARENDPLMIQGQKRKIVLEKEGTELKDNNFVATGSSVVPNFPRILDVNHSSALDSDSTEYQLLGLGIRTVSFLKIKVYVVGIYIATDDLSSLRNAIIKFINPLATTLTPSETDQLTTMLHNPSISEEIWDGLLGDGVFRMLIRIVPTRNTDFAHLRDAWVRAMTARAREFGWKDELFGDSVTKFKKIFSRGSVPRGKEIILSRDKRGELEIWYDSENGREKLGLLQDERISRSLWLGYLAGKNVACENAKEAVISSIMNCTEILPGAGVGAELI